MPPPAAADPGPAPGRPLVLDASAVPPADLEAVPEGFVLVADDGTRLHFLDWGGPTPTEDGPSAASRPSGPPAPSAPAVLLLPGFGQSAWSWTPVARRLRALRRVVVADLRGHGLSDAPVDGYGLESLGRDALAVADGAGLLDVGRLTDATRPEGTEGPSHASRPGIVLAGHGFGAEVAAVTASLLGRACAALVLVDGGWDALAETTGVTPEELVKSLEEPPEVMRSMAAFLEDRRAFDPASWDADQERSARETVVELPSRRLVPAIHPHVRDAIVEAMFAYDPIAVLSRVDAPIVALLAADDELQTHAAAFSRTVSELARAGRAAVRSASFEEGHNLMRYRPAEVAAAILAAAKG